MSTPTRVPGPFSLLDEAIRKVPATKYALAVGAIIAVIAIVVSSFKVNLWVAALGAVVMLVLMTVFVIFASLADQRKELFAKPVLVFTWFSLLLIIATALVVFFSAFWKWPMDLPLGDPREASLPGQMEKLQDANPTPGNTWTAFESDYGELGKLTLQYLHYIEGNRNGDAHNKVLNELRKTLNTLRKRNNQEKTKYFPDKDVRGYHSTTLPTIFDSLLQRIEEDKGAGLSQVNESCYEAAIQRWFADAGFEGATAPRLSPYCWGYLHLQPDLP